MSESHLSVRELDEHLLNGRRVEVEYGSANQIVQCRLKEVNALVPRSLFEIYLCNGLIARISGNEFGLTQLGKARLRRR